MCVGVCMRACVGRDYQTFVHARLSTFCVPPPTSLQALKSKRAKSVCGGGGEGGADTEQACDHLKTFLHLYSRDVPKLKLSWTKCRFCCMYLLTPDCSHFRFLFGVKNYRVHFKWTGDTAADLDLRHHISSLDVSLVWTVIANERVSQGLSLIHI